LWHDHEQEIATGRAQVHDLPPDKAKEVAELVATTDGIIFHLWSHDDKVPSDGQFGYNLDGKELPPIPNPTGTIHECLTKCA